MKNTYKFVITLGVTDLMGHPYNEYGEFQGCSIVNDENEYLQNKQYYDALFNFKNEEYIKRLKETGEYGKEVECDLTLFHNPLFDDNKIIEKKWEEAHPSESFRLVFLDFENTTEKSSPQYEYRMVDYKYKNIIHTAPTWGELRDKIVEYHGGDNYLRWSLENWTQEDADKRLKFLITNKMKTTDFTTKETVDDMIKDVKQLRVNIDKNIQEVRDLEISVGIAEKTLALRKLQEAKMWLGQCLAELGAATPYPHADNPANARVEPTADTYKGNTGESSVTGSAISIHFTLKNQSIEKLKKAIQEVVESYVRDNKSDITFHCFLPKEDVIKKGWSTEVYDELLEPYFGNLVCMNYVNKPINVNREDLFKTLKAMNGVAFFIGAIVDGVQDEFEMAKRHSIHCYTVPLI